jgi:diadenosine tetraphosphate (Ap4A) HIT family hydrolase
MGIQPRDAMIDFALDPRLEADTLPVTDLALSMLRLSKDARFPWLILVPKRPDIAEIIDPDDMDRAILFDEIVLVSRVLRTVTACHKLNVAALGNQVRQLHVHIIARFEDDAAWPRPVWGSGEAVAYEPAARDRLVATLRENLPHT